MQLVRRYRLLALACAFAVLLCAIISWPFSTAGVCDDGPYIIMARTLANTRHIVYNGWASPMLGFQLYLGAAFVKLFGFSFTTVRMSTLFAAMSLAFILQRTLVRSGITDRNAFLGTLALVLSPLYLMLSVTFMTDTIGLCAIVLCAYGCLRALTASTDRFAIQWLCMAVVLNALCGTSRQLAWLGTLVMVPSTLWLLRERRRVLFAGAAATFAGVLFIAVCLHWLKRQPYIIPAPPFARTFSLTHIAIQFARLYFDLPFLLLPVFALFLPQVRKSRPRVIALICVLLFSLIFFALYPTHLHDAFNRLLEPTAGGAGSWISTYEFDSALRGGTPFLHPWAQAFFTIVAYSSLAGLALSFLRPPAAQQKILHPTDISWKQLNVLFLPYTAIYSLFLLSAAGTTYYLYDRYAFGLLLVPVVYLVRYYQDRLQRQLPLAMFIPIAIMAVYGIAMTHNIFAFGRARTALNAELAAHGIPPTTVDSGWDYNFDVELHYADHINNPMLKTPANGYSPVPPTAPGQCKMFWYDRTPHIHPLYGLSFDPNACYGLAPFAPVSFSRWPLLPRETIYVIRYTAPTSR